MQSIGIHITGKVQGVFFRDSTKRKALELGVTGYVRNEQDGSVYAEAEGSQTALDALVAWCHQGPPAARVDSVKVTLVELKYYNQFEIRR